MAIDGLIILDSSCRPIIQSGFRASSPAYPLLHIDAFSAALQNAVRPTDLDPVLYLPLDPTCACCHMSYGGLRFLAPVSGDVDPLFAFAFLQTFIEILQEYFGTVSSSTLKDNFDVVYQLLEETLDAGGHPLTTSPNALRDIVLPPSLISKLLANINSLTPSAAAAIVGGSGNGAFSSPIPWRKAGVKYNNNEIYFDIVEELRAVVGKNGAPLSSNVWGKVETNAKLSGTPDLSLTFSNPRVLADCAFHPCVRLQRWARDKTLSFVPPDGRFTLFDYQYSTATATVAKDIIPLPITLRSTLGISPSPTPTTVDVTLTSRLSTHVLDNVAIEMYLGVNASNVSCTVSRGSGSGSGFGSQTEGVGWTFDPKRNVARWEIASMPPSSSWTLKGSFVSPNARPSRALRITFNIASHSFSSLKVDQLKVLGGDGVGYKPYKGVRARSRGDVEWRI